MKDVWIKRVGTHRGAPRIFLDAAQAARAGFAPGEKFEIEIEGQRVVLTKHDDGSRTVSARRRGDKAHPVIDINSKDVLSMFDGMDAVRVVVGHNKVYLLPLASEVKRKERYDRLRRKLADREPLKMASLCHGGGILSHAIHKGLEEAGVKTELEFVNELREDLLEQACEMNDAWSDRTSALAVPMQEVVQDDWLMQALPKIEILEMGLPCSGASRAGIAKRELSKMEDHPEVGHLMFAALVILNKTQPAAVLLENVPLYATSASAQILRHQLRDMGYECHEAILEGKDFGALENRVRWCLVAVTRGVDFSFDRLEPAVRVVRLVEDVIDPSIREDDPRWSPMKGLKDKRERDAAKGSNFKMQVVRPDDTHVPTLRKGYHKGGSTDPFLAHPTQPELLRKFTAAEHSRIKGVPEHLIDGLSETIAHQVLGQGIVYEPFKAVGRRIGQALLTALNEVEATQGDDEQQSEALRRLMRMTG
jgi:DNA (cytosine-5)-methyltransferase 1